MKQIKIMNLMEQIQQLELDNHNWKARCEAAEEYINCISGEEYINCINGDYLHSLIIDEAYGKWQRLIRVSEQQHQTSIDTIDNSEQQQETEFRKLSREQLIQRLTAYQEYVENIRKKNQEILESLNTCKDIIENLNKYGRE